MLKITPTDEKLEKQGKWTTYLGVKIKVARSNNPDYAADLAKGAQDFKSYFDKGMIPPEESVKALCDSMAKHLLVDWEPFDFEGESINYSVDTASELLFNDKDLREYVSQFADSVSNYIDSKMKDTAGKSTT